MGADPTEADGATGLAGAGDAAAVAGAGLAAAAAGPPAQLASLTELSAAAATDRPAAPPTEVAAPSGKPAPRRSVIVGGGRRKPAAAKAFTPVDVATLGAVDHRGRLQRCQAALPGAAVDALLVTKIEHIRYLTGFSGSNGLCLLGPGGAILVTDGRYEEQAATQLGDAGLLGGGSGRGVVELVINGTPGEVLGAVASGVRRLGLEAASVTWTALRQYAEEWFPYAEMVPTTGIVETLRLVKEPGEVARIEAAAGIVDDALTEVIGRLADRPTELEFAAELEAAMKRRGSSAPAFETIVASGPNGARPHARPGHRRVEAGDLVTIDVGALIDGYASDMTRTVCVGEPSAEQQRLYDVVGEAQDAAVAAVGPGVVCKDVDFAARSRIEAAGWGPQFPHGVGHGVGLEIHEAPHLGRVSESVLGEGWVVTVEPGVYLPGVGGVRTEDTVLVTAGGCRRLTGFPKRLTI
jgi:Xaa-Pro aminopeptidase